MTPPFNYTKLTRRQGLKGKGLSGSRISAGVGVVVVVVVVVVEVPMGPVLAASIITASYTLVAREFRRLARKSSHDKFGLRSEAFQ